MACVGSYSLGFNNCWGFPTVDFKLNAYSFPFITLCVCVHVCLFVHFLSRHVKLRPFTQELHKLAGNVRGQSREIQTWKLFIIMLDRKISKLCIQICFITWRSVSRTNEWELPQWCRGQYSCRSSTGYTWLRGCNSRLHGRAADSSSIWTVWEGSNKTRWMNSRSLCTVHCLMVPHNQRSVLEH